MQLIARCECGRAVVLYDGDLIGVPLGTTRLGELLLAADDHDCPVPPQPPKEIHV